MAMEQYYDYFVNTASTLHEQHTVPARSCRLRKLMYRVVFPFELKLCNTADDCEAADCAYNLFAIVVHIGSGMHHGGPCLLCPCGTDEVKSVAVGIHNQSSSHGRLERHLHWRAHAQLSEHASQCAVTLQGTMLLL